MLVISLPVRASRISLARGRWASASMASLKANLFEHAKNIWAQLNAGADLPEFGRLLENPNRKALVGERVGSNKPADSATGDQKGGGATIRTSHGENLKFTQDKQSCDHKT